MYSDFYYGDVLKPNVIDVEKTMQMQHQQAQLSLLKKQLEELQEKQTENKLIELIKKGTNYSAIRNQAIREFADKLKKISLITENDIERLVKEMTEGGATE